MDLNKVMLIGNVVRDPEMRTTPGGQSVASFSIATNFMWKDKNGQRQQKAEFHNIIAWRRLAEIINQYVKKGTKIYIEGRLETRNWDDQNGIKRYRTEVIADNMILLDRAGQMSGQTRTMEEPDTLQEPTIEPVQKSGAPAEGGEEEVSIEDIPF